MERGRVSLLVRRLRRDDNERQIWGAIVERVLRHTVLSVVLAGGLLVARDTGAPATDGGREPGDLPAVALGDQDVQPAAGLVPRRGIPANVVVEAENVRAPAVKAAIGQLEQQALRQRPAAGPISLST